MKHHNAVIKNLLPETGYLRLSQLLGNPKADPPIPAIFPISKSTLWSWVKEGRFPSPLKLGPRISVWKVEDIRAHISNLDTAEQADVSQCQS